MTLDLNLVASKLVGTSIPKPKSGTLSGHAAGEPFDKHAYSLIKSKFPRNTYRQYEYLNELYLKNPSALSVEQRQKLVRPDFLAMMINRGADVTLKWNPNNQFLEKQNDTADIIINNGGVFRIVDVKTRNKSKKAQQPNIISAVKIAKMCALMLDEGKFENFEIIYLGITWVEKKDQLICTESMTKKLFKTNPSELYINWAAAMQIQFHVEELSQDYRGSLKDWAKGYLSMFIEDAQRRSEKMLVEYVKPYLRFTK